MAAETKKKIENAHRALSRCSEARASAMGPDAWMFEWWSQMPARGRKAGAELPGNQRDARGAQKTKGAGQNLTIEPKDTEAKQQPKSYSEQIGVAIANIAKTGWYPRFLRHCRWSSTDFGELHCDVHWESTVNVAYCHVSEPASRKTEIVLAIEIGCAAVVQFYRDAHH